MFNWLETWRRNRQQRLDEIKTLALLDEYLYQLCLLQMECDGISCGVTELCALYEKKDA